MTPRAREDERGAALLVVMVAVAVLTALAADLAYDTRVSLRIAANARDELRATYLAKSGVALSRLVLSFQQSVDAAIPAIPGQAMPRPQLWKIVPVDSTLAANLFPESGATPSVPPPALGQEQRRLQGASALPPGGGFRADIDDEGAKVNVQLDSSYTGGLLSAQVMSLWQLICDPRWDALFDVEDENGQRYSRADLIINLKDWVDPDPVGSALAASFPGGCSIVIPPGANPFEQGFTDENFPYDRGEDRYRAKNARMDSLGELYLVAGVTDAFMAAFGDSLTVYLSRADKLNLNATDRIALLNNARLIADPPTQPALYDPEFPDKLQKVVLERTLGGMLSLSPLDFGQLVQAFGVKVNLSALSAQSTSNPFTDRSSVFKLRVAGRAGDVTKILEAVVRFDQGQPGQPQQVQPTTTPGQLRHWRED